MKREERIKYAWISFAVYVTGSFFYGWDDWGNVWGGLLDAFWGAIQFAIGYAFFAWLAGEKEDNSPPVI